MLEDEGKGLVGQGSRSPAEIGAGARSILSGVVSDALTVARAREVELATTRFRVGSYEFREPDYRQILIWAKAFEIDPETLVRQLDQTSFEAKVNFFDVEGTIAFMVEEGSIVSMAWDLTALPIETFDWVTGLSLRELAVFGGDGTRPDISFSLPCLRKLFIGSINLTMLDMSEVPGDEPLTSTANVRASGSPTRRFPYQIYSHIFQKPLTKS